MKRGVLLQNVDFFFFYPYPAARLPIPHTHTPIEILQGPGRNISGSSLSHLKLQFCFSSQGWSEAELALSKESFILMLKEQFTPPEQSVEHHDSTECTVPQNYCS